MNADAVARLRAAQDMIRILLGNADAVEADAVLKDYAVSNLDSV
jgi:uncharacterized UPF0146 family protein